MKNPLGRNRMLRRGEFGAAVFEKRLSIRFRLAETINSGWQWQPILAVRLSCLSFAKQNLN